MNAPHLVSRLMFWTAALSVLSGCPMTTAPEEPVVEEPVPGCTDTRAANYDPAATEDDGSCVPVESSEAFLDHAQPAMVPGQFPSSNCTAITSHHDCVGTSGCGWLRTIKDDGVCRADPISRCLTEGDCVCDASDFHGDPAHDADLAVFLPLSIVAENLAETPFVATTEMEPLQDESLINFTSRTDFSQKTLTVRAENEADVAGLLEAEALSLTLKFMHVWDTEPATISGTLLAGLGLSFELVEDQLSLSVGASDFALSGDTHGAGNIKDYQCNQLALVVPETGDATAYLAGVPTTLPGVNLAALRAARDTSDPLTALRIGAANAKVWDVRLHGQGRALSADEVAELGKRCGAAGDYAIPSGYASSNRRYSWGMGGYDIVPNHETQHFASGVYVTLWIPEEDVFPPLDASYRADLHRMVGFWDRWHEQMFFELDMAPFVDNRALEPSGSRNTYRSYTSIDDICADPVLCRSETNNFANPCAYSTDMFQAFNWLPEDFPGEPTSADHRRIAEAGGFGRWDTYDSDIYSAWQRPVHEHGHTAHFTLMRTYEKEHHYIRGIAGEAFAEIMAYYLFAGGKSWMNSGLTYYPSIPLTFEGRWDSALEEHVFRSDQPYQSLNIGDLGLGARFYGLNVWWTYVSHYAAKPYLVGRLSGDTDLTPGTTLQRTRFYLAQEQLDLGDLFGNFVAHVATWDWPYIGHNYHEQEQEPFDGIAGWCTSNTGPECTVEQLKIQAIHDNEGTGGAWIDGPDGVNPGGFAYNTIRIDGVAGGSTLRIGLDFTVPDMLYPDTDYSIGINPECRDDPRFFSSRIVVVEEGTEGQQVRTERPQYYKIPGRLVDDVIVQVPEGRTSTVYVLAIPTPPFELEDVPGFVDGYSLTWPYRYKVESLSGVPAGASVQEPVLLAGDQMLELDSQPGAGFTYDCFWDQVPVP
jgi:hypothetical protein